MNEIVLNGSTHMIPAGTTVAVLLQSLGVVTAGAAVAVNDRVVRASAHASLELQTGDAVEIVRAVSGG